MFLCTLSFKTVNFINQIASLGLIMIEQDVRPHKIKRFFKETIRVLRITKKPNKEEFKSIVKVTGLGILIIGLIGFLIFLAKQLLF